MSNKKGLFNDKRGDIMAVPSKFGTQRKVGGGIRTFCLIGFIIGVIVTLGVFLFTEASDNRSQWGPLWVISGLWIAVSLLGFIFGAWLESHGVKQQENFIRNSYK